MPFPIYIDDIHQVFSSNGNLHILGGCVSGQTTADHKDLSELALHLVMPLDKAKELLPKLVEAVPNIPTTASESNHKALVEENSENRVYEGTPMVFKAF